MDTNYEHSVKLSFKAELQIRVFFGMVLLLGWTNVIVRAMTSAIELTFASALDCRLLAVLTCSLIYFGVVVATRKWGLIMKHSNASTILWIKGVPLFLVLGVITIIWSVSSEQSEINIGAYALQVLIFVSILHNLVYLFNFIFKSLIALRASGIVDKERMKDLWSDAINMSEPTSLKWSDMSARARFVFVATHFCNAALWTWLVIYYRYFCQSFVGHSSWIMAFLWLFLTFEWFRFGGLFLSVWPGRQVAQV